MRGPRRCVAVGCSKCVEARYLFCDRHRGALPFPDRRAIWESCRPGSGGDLRPSIRWASAVASAVELLARAEGLDPSNPFREAVNSGSFAPIAG